MGGVARSPLCFLGGVGGGGPLDGGWSGCVIDGVSIDGETRGDPSDGGNLEVETAGGDVAGVGVTRGATGPKEESAGPTGRVF